MGNLCRAANTHLTVDLVVVGCEAVGVDVGEDAETIVRRKVRRQRREATKKVEMTQSQRRDRDVKEAATIAVDGAEDVVAEVVVVTADDQEQAAEMGLETNHVQTEMTTTRETVMVKVSNGREEAVVEATQAAIRVGSEDVPVVDLHRVPVTREVVTATTKTTAVINIAITNEETTVVVIHDEVEIVIGIVIMVSVTVGIVMVVDRDGEDTGGIVKLSKGRTVMLAAMMRVRCVKSPTRWKMLK